jgi:hypothetical protein
MVRGLFSRLFWLEELFMVIDPHGSSNVDKIWPGLGGFGFMPTQFED